MTNESPSVWSYKPWWCQPWSIILTGCSIIAAIAYFVPWMWLKVLGSMPFLAWMIFFTVIYPKMMADYLEQQHE